MKKRIRGLLSLLLVLAMCISLMPGIALAADDDEPTPAEPKAGKSITDNGDGTYTISLSIEGDAQMPNQDKNVVNVLIVYDISQSMSTTAEGSTNSRGDEAENVVHGFLNTLLGKQADSNGTVEVNTALVTFGEGSNRVVGWNKITEAFVNRFDDGTGEAGNAATNFNYNSYGTNWEAALQDALYYLSSQGGASADPTFVIMFTDGAPTATAAGGNVLVPTQASFTDFRSRYDAATGEARSIQVYDTALHTDNTSADGYANNTTFYGIYAYGTEFNLLDELVYYSNTGNHVDGLMTAVNPGTAYEGADDTVPHYYSASNTTALQNAIDDILSQIVEAIGIGNVEFDDPVSLKDASGTTKVMDLVEVVPNSFKYYRTGGDYGTGTPGTEWTDIPSDCEASVEDGSVKWDLSKATSNGVLEDGVTYTVTFKCATSQDTLDLIAEMKNDDSIYENLSDNDPIKKAITRTGTPGNYSYKMATNGDVTVTYVDTRVGDDPIVYDGVENPQPVPVDAKQIDIEKTWVGTYEGEHNAAKVTIGVLVDGEDEASDSFDLTISGNKHTGSRYISTGVMTVDSNSNVEVIVPGHDFELTEKVEESDSMVNYHWELQADTMHPMLKNGSIVMLVLEEDSNNVPSGVTETKSVKDSEGVAYYKIGSNYYKESTSTTALTAQNIRRADLNLKKEMNDTAPDAVYKYSVKLTLPDDYASDETEQDIYYSLYSGGEYLEFTTNGEQEMKNGTWTGYYHKELGGASGTITLEIPKDKNVRFMNLVSGTEFEIEETGSTPEGFKATKIAITPVETDPAPVYPNEEGLADGATPKITGVIVKANTHYNVVFTNEYNMSTVEVVKTFTGITADEVPTDFTATVTYAAPEGSTVTAPGSVTLKIPAAAENDDNNQQQTNENAKAEGDTETTGDIIPVVSADGLTYTWTIDAVPVGLNVSVEESGTDVDGKTLIPADAAQNASVTTATTVGANTDGTDKLTAKGQTTTLNLTNNYKVATGTLVVVKEFKGDIIKDDVPAITITATDGTNSYTFKTSDTTGLAISEDGLTYTWTKEEVPVGTYTVTESDASATGYSLVTTYSPVAEAAGGDEAKAEEGGDAAATEATVTVTKDTSVTATITNTYTEKPGELTVVKEFKGDITEKEIPEGLTITATGKGENPQTYTLTIPAEDAEPVEGVEFKQEGLKLTWTVVVAPDTYEITESGETVDGYDVETTYEPATTTEASDEGMAARAEDGEEETATSATVTIDKGGKASATVTNEYTAKPGYLTVIKTFAGDLPEDKIPTGLKITVKGDTGKTYELKTSDDEEILTVDGMTYTWNIEVKPGVYTITESNAKVSGYDLETEYAPTELPKQEAALEAEAQEAEEQDEEKEELKKAKADTEEKATAAIIEILAEGDGKATITNTYTKKDTPTPPPELNYVDHYGYMVGYPDGTVRPAGNITRAEVATIFFRLLTDESRKELWCTENDFSDVSSDQWFNNAVSTLANAGILSGYPDGTFKPGNNITRAELATIVARFLQDRISAGVEVNLSDISGHWAEGFIIEVAENGIITGYPDGTFRPDQAITRAETVTMVNRLLQRKPDKDHLLEDMIVWPDNQDTETWFYAAIQEATNSHSYYFSNYFESEVWFELLEMRDWAALEKEWADWNSGTQVPGDPMPNAPQLNP